ncbi:MAG: hypothetical protein IJU35_06090 [Paludibacteraceae bacterium]|nr:hypothetical protein [Paludibacteraceae bacterium]
MKNRLYCTLLSTMLLLLFATSCASKKPVVYVPQTRTFNLALINQPQADKYANLDYGIRLNVQDMRANQRIIQVYDAGSTTSLPSATTNPNVSSFVPESARRYMRTMGFNLDADIATDYLMQLDIKEFHVDYLSGIGWNGTVIMDLKVFDHDRKLVYPTVEVSGRAAVGGQSGSDGSANLAINTAYANALADIDWDRIAFFLHRASSPKKEANKQVQGEGNTALEHLTIHWDIDSRPQGADVSWRVVSSTPDVKNQNYRYLKTTPYEATETFDIKGLTYNNAGDVQIEVKCEKSGYYTQSKRFSVLSIIDEKEISALFRLVKEE